MFVRSSSKESARLRKPSITSPDGKPTHEGWLWKFARSGKWQRRWFRLHGHYLKYYNPAGDPATGALLGEVKAAYDLYDISKEKELKRIAAMDGVEMMIPFVLPRPVCSEPLVMLRSPRGRLLSFPEVILSFRDLFLWTFLMTSFSKSR